MVSFRTPTGFKICGQFPLGPERTFAEQVFSGLKGREDLSDSAVLHLDLVESVNDLPQKIKTLGCKLDELSGNYQYITTELFRVNAIGAGC